MKLVSAGWFVCGFAATLLVSAVVDRASAQNRRGDGYGYVVAESRFCRRP